MLRILHPLRSILRPGPFDPNRHAVTAESPFAETEVLLVLNLATWRLPIQPGCHSYCPRYCWLGRVVVVAAAGIPDRHLEIAPSVPAVPAAVPAAVAAARPAVPPAVPQLVRE